MKRFPAALSASYTGARASATSSTSTYLCTAFTDVFTDPSSVEDALTTIKSSTKSVEVEKVGRLLSASFAPFIALSINLLQEQLHQPAGVKASGARETNSSAVGAICSWCDITGNHVDGDEVKIRSA
ncbi:uncharacterized protein LOC135596138 [Musa acuminata AAA Group]|uniref:uncharacterized protein LOC135596138 n=1 Tax=Musa acuminata AAA Group TaxID=214697 RepID=UPI0031CEBFD9